MHSQDQGFLLITHKNKATGYVHLHLFFSGLEKHQLVMLTEGKVLTARLGWEGGCEGNKPMSSEICVAQG